MLGRTCKRTAHRTQWTCCAQPTLSSLCLPTLLRCPQRLQAQRHRPAGGQGPPRLAAQALSVQPQHTTIFRPNMPRRDFPPSLPAPIDAGPTVRRVSGARRCARARGGTPCGGGCPVRGGLVVLECGSNTAIHKYRSALPIAAVRTP